MKLFNISILALAITLVCVACGSDKPGNVENSLNTLAVKNDSQSDVVRASQIDRSSQVDASETQEIISFDVSYTPPPELSKQVSRKQALTYAVRAKGNVLAGRYRIYTCSDAECSTKKVRWAVSCDDKLACTPNAEASNGQLVNAGDSKLIWTFRHLFSPLFEGKSGVDVFMADPALQGDGFHDEYLAVDFEAASGARSNLKIFYLNTVSSKPANPCATLIRVNDWSHLADGTLACLNGNADFNLSMATLCTTDRGDISATMKSYIAYKQSYEDTQARLKALSTSQPRSAAVNAVDLAKSEWEIRGQKRQVENALATAKKTLNWCK
jgi:hypothetical protein